MQAVVFTARNEVRFERLSDPQPGSGEVAIKVKASGICHTDYEVLKDNYGKGAFPVVPGHEYAGEIVSVGADVTGFAEGDRVVVDPNLECGRCRACRREWAHLCERLGAYGVTAHGGFAEMSVVKAANVHPIGSLGYCQAALAEPMGCVLNGVDAVHAPWMENALIFGAGPMGILMGMALRAEGVPEVTLCDIAESRLELAVGFGFGVAPGGSAALRDWHYQADLVVEATGVPAVAQTVPTYIANGGKGLFFGVCPSDARIEITPFEVFRRQLTFAGSHSLNHNIPRALETLSGLGTDIDRVVSHRLSLEDISTILSFRSPEGSLKVHAVTE